MCRSSRHYIQTIQKRCSTFRQIFIIILHAMHMFNVTYWHYFIYLFIYLLFSHNKDYTSITLYKDVARGPQKTTRLVRGGPLVTIILSNRTITTHNNGQYKTHYRYSRKSKTFVLNDCNISICLVPVVQKVDNAIHQITESQSTG